MGEATKNPSLVTSLGLTCSKHGGLDYCIWLRLTWLHDFESKQAQLKAKISVSSFRSIVIISKIVGEVSMTARLQFCFSQLTRDSGAASFVRLKRVRI